MLEHCMCCSVLDVDNMRMIYECSYVTFCVPTAAMWHKMISTLLKCCHNINVQAIYCVLLSWSELHFWEIKPHYRPGALLFPVALISHACPATSCGGANPISPIWAGLFMQLQRKMVRCVCLRCGQGTSAEGGQNACHLTEGHQCFPLGSLSLWCNSHLRTRPTGKCLMVCNWFTDQPRLQDASVRWSHLSEADHHYLLFLFYDDSWFLCDSHYLLWQL